MGMMLPLTYPKELSVIQRRAVRRAERLVEAGDIVAFHRRDVSVAQCANLTLWICLAGWAASLYLSLAGNTSYFPHIDGERTAFVIGTILWAAAVILDFLRGGK